MTSTPQRQPEVKRFNINNTNGVTSTPDRTLSQKSSSTQIKRNIVASPQQKGQQIATINQQSQKPTTKIITQPQQQISYPAQMQMAQQQVIPSQQMQQQHLHHQQYQQPQYSQYPPQQQYIQTQMYQAINPHNYMNPNAAAPAPGLQMAMSPQTKLIQKMPQQLHQIQMQQQPPHIQQIPNMAMAPPPPTEIPNTNPKSAKQNRANKQEPIANVPTYNYVTNDQPVALEPASYIPQNNTLLANKVEPPPTVDSQETKPEKKTENLFREPLPINAAPYPQLPARREVLILLKQVEFELKATRQKLNELNHLKQQDPMPQMDRLDPSLEIQEYNGMFIPHLDVDRIVNDNKKKAKEVHHNYRITNPKIDHTIGHITHLPFMQTNIETSIENMKYLFDSCLYRKRLAEEKGRKLAREYVERRQPWLNMSKELNELHRQERNKITDLWPAEMIPLLPKPTDNTCLIQFTAPDTPMYLDDVEYESYAYYNTNAFVPDPVKAHKDYKMRLMWTESEKQIFLDKYRLHPREFKKIAAGLQQKTVKDVIEYYYCHRIDLNLKEIEQQSKKRGRKKVITEGSVRK